MKKFISISVKVGVSFGIMYFLFSNMDMEKFVEVVKSLGPATLLLMLAIFFSTQFVTVLRWSYVLAKDVEVPYLRLFSIYFVGMFFNNFLPTMIGGDVIKAYYLYKDTGKGDVSAASILMDRYSGLTAMMGITAIALIPGYALLKGKEVDLFFLEGIDLTVFFMLLLGGYIVASLVLWVEFLHTWMMNILAKIHFFGLNEMIDRFYKVLMSYKGHRGLLVRIVVCSIYVQGGVIIGYIVLGNAIGMDVPAGYYFLFVPLATVIGMIPISLAGLGVREGAFVFLFAAAGASKEQALGLSLVWFAVAVTVSLVGGVEYLRLGGRKELEADKALAEAANARSIEGTGGEA